MMIGVSPREFSLPLIEVLCANQSTILLLNIICSFCFVKSYFKQKLSIKRVVNEELVYLLVNFKYDIIIPNAS